jgi:glutamate N-acetyltransferase/amino-acid N-acetyltransferase
VADVAKVNASSVLPFSTGVIGELLPVDKIEAALPALLESLSEDSWMDAATGIMTTDTVPKLASRTVALFGRDFTLTGISKGAGMIKPNMATMLAYMATDVAIDTGLLQGILSEAVRRSFNRITIDGDTSTNDACVLIATGQSEQRITSVDQAEYALFREAVFELALELAQLIIKDGEGATNFVHVEVLNGANEDDCEKVAYAVAESPLVKTALFASDPNWGRILAAAGRSGAEQLDIDKLTLHINELPVSANGGIAEE